MEKGIEGEEEKLSSTIDVNSIKSVKKLRSTITIDEGLKAKLMAIKRTRDFRTIVDAIDHTVNIYEMVIKDKESNIYNMWILNDLKKTLERSIKRGREVKDIPEEDLRMMESDLASVTAQLDKFISIVYKYYGKPVLQEKKIDPIYVGEASEQLSKDFDLPHPDKFAKKLTGKRSKQFSALRKELVKKDIQTENEYLEQQQTEQVVDEASLDDLNPFGVDEQMKQQLKKEEAENKKLSPLFEPETKQRPIKKPELKPEDEPF